MEHTPHTAAWELRRYWQGDALMEVAWWFAHQPVPAGPEARPERVHQRDYCYRHGTPIYPSLGCQVCGQRLPRARP